MVPWNYDYSDDIYDGLFISNGPGDPALAWDAVLNLRKVCLNRAWSVNDELTIRPVALSGYGPIAHEAKPIGLLARGP